MQQVTVKQLLEAGVHFGHQTRRWNPKMQRYIFGEKSGIYIINLELTLGCLTKALTFLKKTASEGKEVLFVGTKKQGQEVVREAAHKCQMPYVQERWLGGMLTNFSTVRKSVARLDWIDQMEKDGNFKFITKKEASMLQKEREKLIRCLSGVRKMKRLPGALFIIDTKKEEIALKEAIRLQIPTVALIDTNCDPDLVSYPIPGNDDAIRAIKLFCDLACEAIMEGRNEYYKIYPPTAEQKEEMEVHQKEMAAKEVAAEETLSPETEIEAPAEAAETVDPVSMEKGTEPEAPKIVDELEEKFSAEKFAEETKLKVKRPVRPKDSKKIKP